MSKKLFFILLLIASGLDIAAQAPVPTGRRFREIAEDKFVYGNIFIGGTSGWRQWGTPSVEILNREFNFITPNNDFKQTAIHPQPDIWKWDKSDQWVDSARLNKQIIRMHSPISPQASNWAKDDSRTASELKVNMTEYMTELCKHYNGVPEIRWMDVVNETVNRDGTWFGPRPGTDLWENPWPLIGFDETADGLNPPSYIRLAFEIANQYAPDIKLVYNQHGDMEKPMWDKVKGTVLYLRSLGLRVDGIGWQAHLETDFLDDTTVLTQIRDLIDWAHANDLEFHVTENDVDIKNGADEQDQAHVYAEVVRTILEKGLNGVVTWNAWIMRESDGQGAAGRPTLFFDDGSAKPAYYAVQKVLEEIQHESKVTTEITGSGSLSISDGKYLRNSIIEILATPDPGYIFSHWSGDIHGSENLKEILLDSDKLIKAVFLDENVPLQLRNSSGGIRFYPNPWHEDQFKITGFNASKPVHITIHDQTGKLVLNIKSKFDEEIVIDRANNWKSGLYFISLHTEKKRITQKLIIE